MMTPDALDLFERWGRVREREQVRRFGALTASADAVAVQVLRDLSETNAAVLPALRALVCQVQSTRRAGRFFRTDLDAPRRQIVWIFAAPLDATRTTWGLQASIPLWVRNSAFRHDAGTEMWFLFEEEPLREADAQAAAREVQAKVGHLALDPRETRATRLAVYQALRPYVSTQVLARADGLALEMGA